jgi:hypothetical protein
MIRAPSPQHVAAGPPLPSLLQPAALQATHMPTAQVTLRLDNSRLC